jgi:hypothetical protein
MGDLLDPEENMFLAEQNGNASYEDDDDNEDLSFDENSLMTDSFEDDDEDDLEDDDDEDEDEENNTIFDDEDDEDDDEDDDDFTDQELEDFNKKLGTNFTSVEELKNSFNKKDQESAEEKERAEYTLLTNRVNLYDQYIGLSNESLIKNQLISQAKANNKDINSQDVLDEIDDKIESLRELDQLDTMADTLRSNLQNQRDKTQASVDKIDQSKVEKENQVARNNVAGLQSALSTIFEKGDFMGITVSKEDINEVYSDIRNNKFFTTVNQSQEMIAKLAMFIKYEKEISKLVSAPTHSDKTKTAFEFLSNNGQGKARSLQNAKGTASSTSARENTMNFLK